MMPVAEKNLLLSANITDSINHKNNMQKYSGAVWVIASGAESMPLIRQGVYFSKQICENKIAKTENALKEFTPKILINPTDVITKISEKQRVGKISGFARFFIVISIDTAWVEINEKRQIIAEQISFWVKFSPKRTYGRTLAKKYSTISSLGV